MPSLFHSGNMGTFTLICWLLVFIALFLHHSKSAVHDVFAHHRNRIQDIKDNDQCRCWKLFFGDARARTLAKRDCRDALKAFKSLPNDEQSKICPNARKQKCRGRGKSHLSWSCSFKCDLTPEEKNHYYTVLLKDPPKSLKKNLQEIINGFARYKAVLDRIERMNSQFPPIWDR